jgi:hypothetical protein
MKIKKRTKKISMVEKQNIILKYEMAILEKRIQGMSEIITDFEDSIFTADVDDDLIMMSNNNTGKPLSEAIEINVFNVETTEDGKKFSFKLKHPRTYR